MLEKHYLTFNEILIQRDTGILKKHCFLFTCNHLHKDLIMKLSRLALAIAGTIGVMTTAHSAGLERSQQSIAPLFEEGNYAEATYAYVNPELEAKDGGGFSADDMIEEYGFAGAAVKVAPTENTALALFYHKPWGVDTTYPTSSKVFSNKDLGDTQAHVDSDALGLVAGTKLGKNFTVYTGIEYQTVSGNVKAATPQPLGAGGALTPTLYTLDIDDEHTFVPMVGFAYEKPEIAMRAAVTYRGPAEYNVETEETFSAVMGGAVAPLYAVTGKANISFPQSVSVDFETGLSEKYQLLGMINARWIDWTEFEVAPSLNNTLQKGEPLASYEKDQYSVEVAVGKKFTPKFGAEIRASYDSGTGADLSLLGPYDSVTGIAVGAQYDVNDKLSVGGGVQYMMVEGGQIPSQDPNNPALKVEDSNAYALGMKVGYHF